MQFSKINYLVAFLLFPFISLAQSTDFKQEMIAIEALQTDGKYKSALNATTIYLDKALAANNTVEVFRALNLTNDLVQNAMLESEEKHALLESVSKKASKSSDANKAVMYHFLATVFTNYPWVYDLYSWNGDVSLNITIEKEVFNYSNAGDSKVDDLIKKLYLTALAFPVESGKISHASLYATEISKEAALFLPSLQDVIANDAIQYFQSSEAIPVFAADGYLKSFVPTRRVVATDSALVLSLYQQIELFNFQRQEMYAYSNWNLERLDYLKNLYTDSDVNEVYVSALDSLKSVLNGHPATLGVVLTEIQQRRNTVDWKYDWRINTGARNNNEKDVTYLASQKELYPTSYYVPAADELLKSYKDVFVQLILKKEIALDQNSLLTVNYKNIGSIALGIYHIDAIDQTITARSYRKYTLTEVDVQTLTLDQSGLYNQHGKDFILPKLKKTGRYLILAAASKEQLATLLSKDTLLDSDAFNALETSISTLKVVATNGEKGIEVLVRDAASGKPVSGAKVQLKSQNNAQVFVGVSTDKNGYALMDKSLFSNSTYYISLSAVKGSDSSATVSLFVGNKSSNTVNLSKGSIFIDRSLYRPGQKVYFKYVEYEGEKNAFNVRENQPVSLELINPNGKSIQKIEGVTNEFGSFAGSLMLPNANNLNGQYTLVGKAASVYFNVEEYKLPTYQITLSSNEKTFSGNDSLLIEGSVKALSGYAIAQAKVQLSLVEQYYWYRVANKGTNLALDTTLMTDKDGKFSFYFYPELTDENAYKSFAVNAFVTSAAGESQEANTYVSVGKKKDALSGDVPSTVWTTDTKNIVFKMTDNQAENVAYDLRIYRLKDMALTAEDVVKSEFSGFTDKAFAKAFPTLRLVYEKQSENDYERLSTKTLLTGDSISLMELIQRKPGAYKIEVQLEQDEAIQTFKFISIDPASSKGQHVSFIWSGTQQATLKVGDVAKVLLGSSFKKAPVLVRWYRGNTVIASEYITVKKRKYLEYTITQADLGGITFEAVLVANANLYTTRTSFAVPNLAQNLTVQLVTQRDLLTPGGKEKWSFKITDATNKGAIAEVLALMTDHSLVQLSSPQNYELNPFSLNYTTSAWSAPYVNSRIFAVVNGDWGNDDNFTMRGSRSDVGYGNGVGSGAKSSVSMLEVQSLSPSSKRMVSYDLVTDDDVKSESNSAVKTDVQIRANFDETAFFYPQLRTDAQGDVTVEFTLPDALTQWDLNILAHGKKLENGQLSQQFKAAKTIMVQPNAPRFLREGDGIDFTSTVVNNSDESIKAVVSIEWFNPFTNEVLANYLGNLTNQTVDLSAHETAKVTWRLNVPKDALSLIAYRIKVASGSAADAEEKAIPILSNRVEVVESIPHTLTKSGSTKVEVKALNNPSTTKKDVSLSIAYASSPIWSVMTAIPSVLADVSENAIALSDKYFVNELAAQLVKANPEILRFVKSMAQVAPTEFSAALAKNQALTSILLDETPWLLNATDETQQKMRILSFFDENAIVQTQTATMDKLLQTQNTDGGWSWFVGRESNPTITAHILMNLARLNQTNLDVFAAGFHYLTTQVNQEYSVAKKTGKIANLGLSADKIQWLYLHSVLQAENSDVVTFYTNLLIKNWKSYGLKMQALAGYYFANTSNDVMAKKIFASIDDRKTVNAQLGTYWNENKNSYDWDRNAIETQAQMIAFYQYMKGNKTTIEGMRNWLMNQKRGQLWETNKATAQACFALLNASDEVKTLTSNTQPKVSIQVGNDRVEVKTNEVGAYTKTYTADQIKPTAGTIQFIKESNALNFASVTYVYTEEISKVQSNTQGLKLNKTIVLLDGSTEVQATTFKVGDRIRVKLQLTADRAMEYMYLKDLRAAGTESLAVISGHKNSGNLMYYQVSHDANMAFFIDYLPKGTYHLTYDLVITAAGYQSLGFASVESLYAPEFKANSSAIGLKVEE